MPRDLEKINKVRVESGLEPLDKLPEEAAAPIVEVPTPPVIVNQLQQEAPVPPVVEKPATPSPDADIDDAKLLAALNKKGYAFASLEDLKPKEVLDPEKLAEQKESSKLSYALNNGLFTTKEYEKFVRERSNPQDLVFGAFYEEAKKDDPDLTDEDIQTEFEQKYGLSEGQDSRKFKRGMQEIGMLAKKILEERYQKIYSADSKYAAYETTEKQKQERHAKLLSQAPLYKADVETVFEGLKKWQVPIGEKEAKESFEVAADAKMLTDLKNQFLDADFTASQITGGWTKENLKDVALTALIQQNFAGLAEQVAKQYHLKRQAGVRGIVPQERGERTGGRVLTENQRQVLYDNGYTEDSLPKN